MNIKTEQIKHIYQHVLAGVLGQTIVSAAIVYILFGFVNTQLLIIWSASKTLLLLLRLISFYLYQTHFKSSNHSKIIQWFNLYRIIMFLSGLLWASSLYLAIHFQPADLLFFFLATFVALAGAAVATLGTIFSIYLLFTIPMLSATVFTLVSSSAPAHFETGLLTLVGFSFLIYAAYKNSLTFTALFQRTTEFEISQKEIIYRLGMAGEYRDNDTGQHVKRMSHSCYLLALKAGLSEKTAEQLYLASALHDIGKIGIPDSILLSPNKLNNDDWTIMKTHTTIGEHILSNHDLPVMKLAAQVAAGHHERWDGSGYPKGLSQDNIPLESRIVSICDVFDALISVRPYKQAWTTQQAIDYISNESGKHFDPILVDFFIQLFPEVVSYADQHTDTNKQRLSTSSSCIQAS